MPTRRPLRRASGEEEVMPGKETAASIGAPATNSSRLEGVQWHQCHRLPAGAPFRRVSGEETVRPVKGTVLQSRGRRRHSRTAHGRGGKGGWRRYNGGNATGRRRERA